MIRLWCATVYVFNEAGDQCLFMNHRKLKKWLPPGGKIDPNEIPDHAALRETFEETGVNVKLLGEVPPVEGGYVRPWGTQVNVVRPGELEHIDLIYLAVPVGDSTPRLNERESAEVAWIAVEKIVNDTSFNTFDSVRTWVTIFAREFKK